MFELRILSNDYIFYEKIDNNMFYSFYYKDNFKSNFFSDANHPFVILPYKHYVKAIYGEMDGTATILDGK